MASWQNVTYWIAMVLCTWRLKRWPWEPSRNSTMQSSWVCKSVWRYVILILQCLSCNIPMWKLFYRGADKFLLARPGRKQATATKLWLLQATQKNSEGCPSNQASVAAMTSTLDEKWWPFNCFFFRVRLRMYRHLLVSFGLEIMLNYIPSQMSLFLLVSHLLVNSVVAWFYISFQLIQQYKTILFGECKLLVAEKGGNGK